MQKLQRGTLPCDGAGNSEAQAASAEPGVACPRPHPDGVAVRPAHPSAPSPAASNRARRAAGMAAEAAPPAAGAAPSAALASWAWAAG